MISLLRVDNRLIHGQVAEDLVEALAQRHGHHAGLLRGFLLGGGLGLGLRFFLGLGFPALLGHVFDLQVDQLAQTQAKFQSLGGLVGVNVHLHGAQVAGEAAAKREKAPRRPFACRRTTWSESGVIGIRPEDTGAALRIPRPARP